MAYRAGLGRGVVRFVAGLVIILTVNTASMAQGSGIIDRFSDALETVQSGLDLILPDDFDMRQVRTRIGLGSGFVPDYAGSNNYRLRFLPIIDIRYKDRWQLNNGRLTVPIYRTGAFETGPSLSLLLGRDEDRNAALGGFGDINATIEVGAFARYRTRGTLLEADFRQALGAGQGRSLRLIAGQGFYKNGNFSLAFAARAKWLSRKATQTNFGITAEQAAASTFGLPEFIAGAGFSELNANLIGAYQLNEKTRLLSLLSYGRLFGDASNSPLVNGPDGNGVGSANQFIGGIAISFELN